MLAGILIITGLLGTAFGVLWLLTTFNAGSGFGPLSGGAAAALTMAAVPSIGMIVASLLVMAAGVALNHLADISRTSTRQAEALERMLKDSTPPE